MKNIILLGLTLALLWGFSGCAMSGTPDQTDAGDLISEQTDPGNTAPDQTGASDSTPDGEGITLAQIRKAAEDSGYTVSDGHQLVFVKEVEAGISVEITADGENVIYSVVECKTENAAAANAKEIDDAGYNIAIRSGKYLTCYDVNRKDGMIKDILASLLEGKPVSETAPKAETASIVGTWAPGTASGKYNAASGEYEDVSGMGILYSFQEDGTFAQLIIFDQYTMITGKYCIEGDKLTLTDRAAKESSDSGATWENEESLPDASSYFATGTEGSAKYLLLGQEDAEPPLNAGANAVQLTWQE